ncbi:MAG: hypothetical protein LIO51_06245 [Clostridiales bacterium]|nr:hypothetical protein [Clostridiales bacterium]
MGETNLREKKGGLSCRSIAHRGLSAEAPENSLLAFELAGQRGVWGIETDVHATADGALVCIHDDTVDRTTDGTGPVREMTLEQLRRCRIDRGRGLERCEDRSIPTPTTYLDVCRRYGAVAVIELKGLVDINEVRAVYEAVRGMGMEERCMCISFQIERLRDLRALTKDIPVQLLTEGGSRATVDRAAALGNSGIDFRTTKTGLSLPAYAHQKGCTVNVWTVNWDFRKRMWAQAGADFITSNRW